MSTALHFNLTEYTDFRQLEFELMKLQDENQALKFKLHSIESLYKKAIKESQQKEMTLKQNESKTKNEQQHLKGKVEQVITAITHIKAELLKLDQLGIDCGLVDSFGTTAEVHLDTAAGELTSILNCLMALINRNSQLSIHHQRQLETIKAENRLLKKNESDFKEEMSYLAQEVNKLEKVNGALTNEANLLRRENKDLKLKVYELGEETEQSLSRVQDQAIEDNNFSVDLLHYQKQLLERTFQKTISAIQDQSLNSIIQDIYASCEAVAEIFREKLQIQYDLQDLENEYRRQKNTKVSQKLLIELRKQIEDFRSQLQKQRDLLAKEEANLQELFLVLRATDKEQKLARNYALDMQKQLQKIREGREEDDGGSSVRELKMIKQTKRNSEDCSPRGSSRIRFKANQDDAEVMREVILRDRQNIQKMFKQTRRNYLRHLD